MICQDRVCPLCGGREFSSRHPGLLLCAQCGLIADPAVWSAAGGEAIQHEWFETDDKDSPWVRRFERWQNRRTLARMSALAHTSGRLLEIGVGSGSFLRVMRDAGWNVEGCDLSRTLCNSVSARYGITMHNAKVDALPGDLRFEAVVMNHVLEHVSDPLELLTHVRARLCSDGLVHIAVPNVASWEARLSGWNSYEPYHLFYFSPATLRTVLQKAGFELLQLETHDSFSGWLLSLLRTLLPANRAQSEDRHRRKSLRRSSWIEHVYGLALVAWGALFYPLRRLQSWLGRGDELIAVARPGVRA